jgi:glycosyltransferase involved in cell wall biosynthesis
LKVGIDATMLDGHVGGVQQVVMGLASALSRLSDADEYLFLTYEGGDEWLRPYVSGPCRIVPSGPAPRQIPNHGVMRFVRPAARRVRDALALARGPVAVPIARSNGTIEREGVDVVHFPKQVAFLTSVPSIYHPWDLQHVHLPHLFPRYQRMVRDTMYRRFCEEADRVCVASEWTKHDLVTHFHLAPEKIAVVPMAAATEAYVAPTPAVLREVKAHFQLPEKFFFYPAQTFRHKNHLGLLDAVAMLRDDDLRVHVVCSGTKNEFYPEIEKRLHVLGLQDQVSFLGFVTSSQLRALYELAHGVIFPTLFEGWGLPVIEAFGAGRPVACSRVTSLPDSAGDAALLFDPHDPRQIAEAMRRLWKDEQFCRELVQRGHERVKLFTWEKTAVMFRDLYRDVARRHAGMGHEAAPA